MKKETELLFNALSALEDVRELLRETAPEHKLNKEQKVLLKKKTGKVREYCNELERML